MSSVALSALPGDARAWCFGASEGVEERSAAELRLALSRFLAEWTAHRAELRAAGDLLHDRFLVVAVDESVTGASGCSIDALMAEVGRMGDAAGVELLDSSPVWYRAADGGIRRVDREEFRRLASAGDVDERTKVFDLTVDRLESVRSGRWEVEAGESWHARLL
ncbi:MAG: hypothetical protein ACR2GQ_04330 [Gemmatimonadota bacterium]